MKNKIRNIIIIIISIIITFSLIFGLAFLGSKTSGGNDEYSYEIIDKWQDSSGKFLRGSTTVYHLRIKATRLNENQWSMDRSGIHHIKSGYAFYSRHNVGDKWVGNDNWLREIYYSDNY